MFLTQAKQTDKNVHGAMLCRLRTGRHDTEVSADLPELEEELRGSKRQNDPDIKFRADGDVSDVVPGATNEIGKRSVGLIRFRQKQCAYVLTGTGDERRAKGV